MVYLPRQNILLEADAYNPPAQPPAGPAAVISPYNLSLLDNVARLKIDVERIIPVHYAGDNRIVTLAEVRRGPELSSSRQRFEEVMLQRLVVVYDSIQIPIHLRSNP